MEAKPSAGQARPPFLDRRTLRAAARKLGKNGQTVYLSDMAVLLGMSPSGVRKAAARLRTGILWDEHQKGGGRKPAPMGNEELARRIAARPLPALAFGEGVSPKHARPNRDLDPREVDDPKLHGVLAVPRSNRPASRVRTNAEIVRGYLVEYFGAEHGKGCWA